MLHSAENVNTDIVRFSNVLHVKSKYNMETMINDLYFDKKMVSMLEEKKVDLDILYVYLMNGKITLQEYLYLCDVRR